MVRCIIFRRKTYHLTAIRCIIFLWYYKYTIQQTPASSICHATVFNRKMMPDKER